LLHTMRTIRRRRQEGKTDYKARLALLKSNKQRLVIRKSNRYLIAQIVESDTAQDKVLFGLSSKSLIAKGWPENTSIKNLAAAYLTGFLLGKKAKEKAKEVIVDFGMNRNVKKSKIYAVVKGAVDSGLKIIVSPDVLPTLEEIKSKDTHKLLDKIAKEK